MSMSTNVCLEPACIQSSAQILWNLAPDYKSYDPCTQFEEMVCYGFRERNPINSLDLALGSDFNRRVEKIILESNYEFAANYTSTIKRSEDAVAVDKANFAKLQQSYNACMDEATIQKEGIEPLADFISQISELFPVKDSTSLLTKSDYTKFQAAIIYLETYDISTFELLDISTNLVNSSETAVYINIFTTTVSNSSIYEDENALNDLKTLIETTFTGMAKAQGEAEDAQEIGNLAAAIVAFEVELYNASTEKKVVADNDFIPTGYPVTLQDLDELSPVLGYAKILAGLIPQNAKIDTVWVISPTLVSLIGEVVERTPMATLQSWLVWRALSKLQDYVESSIFTSVTSTSASARAETCISHVSKNLRFIMGRFYVTSSFSSSKRIIASKMLTDIRAQFVKRIQALSWMSDEVKQRAVAKVNNIQQNIGYPSSPGSHLDLLDPVKISTLYAGQNITDSFFKNQLEFQKWSVSFAVSKLGKPVDRGFFSNALDVTNAFYSPVGNNIFILAGIMQGSTFDPELPWYASYGALGAILGHELTHGFDNIGRLFNENGSLASWWDNSTTAEFEKRSQCFVDQYNNFTYPSTNGSTHVDGKHTLGENLADAGGLHTAFDAWMANRAALELSLPSLDMFTHEQLFYVFYANLWCSDYSPTSLQLLYGPNEHSAPPVRIKGMTENSRGFREVFNCPVKEPVCELW